MKEGGVFRTFEDNDRQEITIAVGEPGAYRCEVFLHSGRFRRLPWILANPIFVARPVPAKRSPAAADGANVPESRRTLFQG